MRLKVLLPAGVFLDEEVIKVTAEAENGSFCLLPRHVDFVTSLIPGILSYVTPQGQERFVALDGGILVKKETQIQISAAGAVPGDDLLQLQELVEKELKVLTESEKKARAVMARLEVDTLRRFSRMGGER